MKHLQNFKVEVINSWVAKWRSNHKCSHRAR